MGEFEPSRPEDGVARSKEEEVPRSDNCAKWVYVVPASDHVPLGPSATINNPCAMPFRAASAFGLTTCREVEVVDKSP